MKPTWSGRIDQPRPRPSTCQDGVRAPGGAGPPRLRLLCLPARSCPRSSLRLAAGSCSCPAGPPGPWGSQTPAAAAAPPWPPASAWLPGEPLVLRLTLPLTGRPAFPPSHCFWFPLLERPKPTCKGQTRSFRHKRKLVPAPWACASLSPAQGKGEAGGPLQGPSPPIPPSRGSQGRGGCDCSLGLERKLQRGLGWETGGRGPACSGGGDGFSTHGRGGKGRGWGLPWEARG